MKVIGITGGVGTGKSQVLSYLKKEYDAIICQADHVAWDLQKPGKTCYLKIVTSFGEEILNEDKTINRSKLGEIVFSNHEKLLLLNQIMHPTVKDTIGKLIEEAKTQDNAYFIIEAALLLEANFDMICDEVWYIYSDISVRRERLKKSRNYSDEKVDSIMATQLSEDMFQKRCQIIIDNSGSFADTCFQIDQIMKC